MNPNMNVTGGLPVAQNAWANSQAAGGGASVDPNAGGQGFAAPQQQVSLQPPVGYVQQQVTQQPAGHVQQQPVTQQPSGYASGGPQQQQQPAAVYTPPVQYQQQQPIVHQQQQQQPVVQHQQQASIPTGQQPVQQQPIDQSKKPMDAAPQEDIFAAIMKETGNAALAGRIQSIAMQQVAEAERESNDFIQSQAAVGVEALADILRTHQCGSDADATMIKEAAESVQAEGRLCDFFARIQSGVVRIRDQAALRSTAGGGATAPASGVGGVVPMQQQQPVQQPLVQQQQYQPVQQPLVQQQQQYQPVQHQQVYGTPQQQPVQQQWQQPQQGVQQQPQQSMVYQTMPTQQVPVSPYAPAYNSMTKNSYRSPGQSKWNFNSNKPSTAQPQQQQQQQQQTVVSTASAPIQQQQQPTQANSSVLASRAAAFNILKRPLRDCSMDGADEYFGVGVGNKQGRQ